MPSTYNHLIRLIVNFSCIRMLCACSLEKTWKNWQGYYHLHIFVSTCASSFRGKKFVTRNRIHMCCKFNLVKYWLPNCFLLATIMYVIYVGDFLSSWWIYDINIFCRIILSKTTHSFLYINISFSITLQHLYLSIWFSFVFFRITLSIAIARNADICISG